MQIQNTLRQNIWRCNEKMVVPLIDPKLLSRIFTKRYTMSGIVNYIKEPTLVNTHTYKSQCTLVTSWNVQPILILKDTSPESGTAVGYYVEAPFSILGAAESPVARGRIYVQQRSHIKYDFYQLGLRHHWEKWWYVPFLSFWGNKTTFLSIIFSV